MGKIKRGNFQFFRLDVLPDIHLRPIAEGKNAKMFAVMFASIKKVPQFRPLVFGIPEMPSISKDNLLRTSQRVL